MTYSLGEAEYIAAVGEGGNVRGRACGHISIPLAVASSSEKLAEKLCSADIIARRTLTTPPHAATERSAHAQVLALVLLPQSHNTRLFVTHSWCALESSS